MYNRATSFQSLSSDSLHTLKIPLWAWCTSSFKSRYCPMHDYVSSFLVRRWVDVYLDCYELWVLMWDFTLPLNLSHIYSYTSKGWVELGEPFIKWSQNSMSRDLTLLWTWAILYQQWNGWWEYLWMKYQHILTLLFEKSLRSPITYGHIATAIIMDMNLPFVGSNSTTWCLLHCQNLR